MPNLSGPKEWVFTDHDNILLELPDVSKRCVRRK